MFNSVLLAQNNSQTILKAFAVVLPFVQVLVLLAFALKLVVAPAEVVAYSLFTAFVVAFENLFLLELTFVPALLLLQLN